jgi:ribonuclease-3
MTKQSAPSVNVLLNRLGFKASPNEALYRQALTHSSYTYENNLPSIDSNERLEFLGDAVLKLTVSDLLLELFPDYREGDLTKIRAVLVSDAVLAEIATELDLPEFLILGESERRSQGAHYKTSTLACAFEALLGAFYLDGRTSEVKTFLRDILLDKIHAIDANKTKNNYKAVLQEKTQAIGLGLPEYETIGESGPAHNRTFTVKVSIQNEEYGEGSGKSKKEAQQNAAREAFYRISTTDGSASTSGPEADPPEP